MLVKSIAGVLVFIVAYLTMWPVSMNPEAWQPPEFIAPEGPSTLPMI